MVRLFAARGLLLSPRYASRSRRSIPRCSEVSSRSSASRTRAHRRPACACPPGLAFVRDPVALVRHLLAPLGNTYSILQPLDALFEPDRDVRRFRRKTSFSATHLLALLGDALSSRATRANSSNDDVGETSVSAPLCED
jgi:hypothetical protein